MKLLRIALLVFVALVVVCVIAIIARRELYYSRLETLRQAEEGLNRVPPDLRIENPYRWEMRQRLHNALIATNVRSIKRPAIAVCAQLGNTNRFVIQWIEQVPTADSIQMLLADGTVAYSSPIPKSDQEENRRRIERTILFAATFNIADSTAATRAIASETGREALYAVLLKEGRRISTPAPVLLFPKNALYLGQSLEEATQVLDRAGARRLRLTTTSGNDRHSLRYQLPNGTIITVAVGTNGNEQAGIREIEVTESPRTPTGQRQHLRRQLLPLDQPQGPSPLK